MKKDKKPAKPIQLKPSTIRIEKLDEVEGGLPPGPPGREPSANPSCSCICPPC